VGRALMLSVLVATNEMLEYCPSISIWRLQPGREGGMGTAAIQGTACQALRAQALQPQIPAGRRMTVLCGQARPRSGDVDKGRLSGRAGRFRPPKTRGLA
jgi:hypothetical protein